MTSGVLPMFPLGSVLFPHGVLPLHVFEPRYRSLVEDCLAAEPEFGVVLIERGSEVGGGDVRFGVGTVARIVDLARFPDGRYALATVGLGRVRVREWLPDDPYPRALVDAAADQAAGGGDHTRREEAVRGLRRVLALAAELGADVATIPELSDDPVRAGWEIAALAPLGPLDALRVLDADRPSDRLDLLVHLLEDAAEMLATRLGGDD